MNNLKVPPAIKTIFDAFPVVTYPPIANTTESKKKDQESQNYYFKPATELDDDSKFKLGIYNIIEVENVMIPSDPVSFGMALILADINKLKLPTSENEKSRCCLTQLSCYSSPNEQLPMLIEDQNDTRSIKTSQSLNALILKRMNCQEKVINQFFTDLYDCWLLCLLTEDLSMNTWKSLFKFDATILDHLQLYDLIQQISNWRSFKVRIPQLFETNYTFNAIDYLHGKNKSSLTKYYHLKLSQISKQLPVLLSYKKSNFITLKLLAYFISIDQTLSSTKLGSLIKGHQTYLNECYKTLKTL